MTLDPGGPWRGLIGGRLGMADVRESWFDGLRELERRAAGRSPYYMAKYVLGRTWMKNGVAWGWEAAHVEVSRQIWGLWKTRHLRPWGTVFKLEWSRDTRKSELAKAFQLCVLVDNPDTRILLDSDKTENSEKKLATLRAMFEDEYFVELFGDLKGENWTKGSITLKRAIRASDPSIAAGGVEAGKTGQHYNLAINDDTQVLENSQTEEGVEKVWTNFELYEALLVKDVDEQGRVLGPFVLLAGTRWAFNDLFSRVDTMEREDSKYGRPRRVFTSRKACFKQKQVVSEEGEISWVDDESAPQFPTTLDLQTIMMKKASMTEAMFSFNYLLKPMSKAMQKFHREWFKRHKLEPADVTGPGWNVYGLLDPAGQAIKPEGMKTWATSSGKAGGDGNAVIVVAVNDMAQIHVLEYVYERMDRDELFEAMIRLTRIWHMMKGWVVEQRFKQYQLAAWLKAEATKPVKTGGVKMKWLPYKPDYRDKIDRIMDLQPYAKNGKLLLREGMTEMENQFVGLGRNGVHDDLPDAVQLVLPVMLVPGHRKKEDIWGKTDWQERMDAAIAAGELAPEDKPRPEDVKTWRMIERIKKEARRRKGFVRMIGGG
jgi:predicted phage terminase large subunit-like protein